MDSAVVTLTCPSCGGQVEGVRTTADEQTVRCTFSQEPEPTLPPSSTPVNRGKGADALFQE